VPANKYILIDALRGIAATAVVLYHVARHLEKNNGTSIFLKFFQFGHAGVDLFFVLSGFIIFHAHANDIGRPDRLSHYWWRRFTRVVPMYWIALIITIALGVAGGHEPAISTVLLSLLPLPSQGEPLLGVAWTLQYEFLFYILFCCMIVSRGLGTLLFALWFALIMASTFLLDFSDLVPPSLFGFYNIEFFLGLSAALAFRRGLITRPRRAFQLGSGLFLAAALCENLGIFNGYGLLARLLYGVPAMMLVCGAAGLNRDGLIRVPGLLRLLGDSSYSLYLFQFVFIGIAWQALKVVGVERVTMVGCFCCLSVAGIAGGILIGRCVESPILRWIRR
jgi:peptidoglycan/LPS O-acetylase OafA/YrhL